MISKPCPLRVDLAELARRSVEAFEQLSPEQKKAHRREQAISFVFGNLMDNPNVTRETVEKAYDER